MKKIVKLGNINEDIAVYTKFLKIDLIDFQTREGLADPTPAYELRVARARNKKIGDDVVHEVGAPGIGKITYRITKIDTNGDYFGVCMTNSVRILSIDECR